MIAAGLLACAALTVPQLDDRFVAVVAMGVGCVGLVVAVVARICGAPWVMAWTLTLALAALASPFAAEIVIQEQLHATRARGDAIAAAIERFRADRGTFPAELNELVPTYIDRLPHTALGTLTTQEYGYGREDSGVDYALGFEEPGFFSPKRWGAVPRKVDP